MTDPSPRLLPDGPLELVEARTLFTAGPVRRRNAATVTRLEGGGRLLMLFSQVAGPARSSTAALMQSSSDDDGRTWSEPIPLYAYPGWFCLSIGGIARIRDDLIKVFLGRFQLDLSLGGTEPMTSWHVASTTSRDGGVTWSEPGPEIKLFPTWTELYGASNPHRLADGRLMWAVSGTDGRDVAWQSGVTFSDADGEGFVQPTLIAKEAGRDYSDTDIVRLSDGRFLAVVREHQTLQSVVAYSADEGTTWSALRPTPYRASNPKLFRLRSGAVVCAYRDEDPDRRGVSVSLTEDAGETWRFLGQLYAADPTVEHEPGSVCGYPDMLSLGGDGIGAVLHAYPTSDGVQLHWLTLRDRS